MSKVELQESFFEMVTTSIKNIGCFIYERTGF